MMLGYAATFGDNAIGKRFMMGKPTWAGLTEQKKWLASAWLAPTHLYTVENVIGRQMWARDQNGDLREFELSNHLGQKEITGPDRANLVWMGQLPNGSYEEIAIFAEALLSERRGQNPFAFYVRKITPGTIVVNLVCFAAKVEGQLDREKSEPEGRFVGHIFIGNDIEMDAGEHLWTEGSFIVAKGFSIRREDDGRLISQAGQIVPILEATTPDEIGAWFPNLDIVLGNSIIRNCDWTALGSLHDFNQECERGIARSEPNRALFFWYPDKAEAKPESTDCYVLGSEGNTFFDVDAIADYFYGENLEHGLWIIDNAKWWSYSDFGEYDSGIDGDWRRATMEDIEHFGFDLASLNKELADIQEVDLDPELAQTLLAIVDTPSVYGPSMEEAVDG